MNTMTTKATPKKEYTIEQALQRIEELELECESLRSALAKYEDRLTPGRKPHDEKWQAGYDIFVEHYEKGESIPAIVETTPFSRRTVYRYKKYYDSLKAD